MAELVAVLENGEWVEFELTEPRADELHERGTPRAARRYTSQAVELDALMLGEPRQSERDRQAARQRAIEWARASPALGSLTGLSEEPQQQRASSARRQAELTLSELGLAAPEQEVSEARKRAEAIAKANPQLAAMTGLLDPPSKAA